MPAHALAAVGDSRRMVGRKHWSIADDGLGRLIGLQTIRRYRSHPRVISDGDHRLWRTSGSPRHRVHTTMTPGHPRTLNRAGTWLDPV